MTYYRIAYGDRGLAHPAEHYLLAKGATPTAQWETYQRMLAAARALREVS